MSNEMKEFIKKCLIDGDNIVVKFEFCEGTWFFNLYRRAGSGCSRLVDTKYYFTSDSRMAQLFIHDLERCISDVRHLWFNGERENN